MRTLIVEDTEKIRKVLDVMLSSYGETVLVENGAQGVWAVEESLSTADPFDLVCLDIKMPEMDGLEALHAIREAEKRHEAKRCVIVMVTASSSPEDMLKALEHEGCDAFVVKPVLWQTLRGVLSRHGFLEEAHI